MSIILTNPVGWMLEILVCLAWLAVVSTLGMTKKENGYSTQLKRGNINRGAPITELAKW